MTSIGIREFKAHLSQYVQKVKRGEALALTEHGKTVATIMPVMQSPAEERMWGLVRRGTMDWSGGRINWKNRRRIKLKGQPLSETVVAMRREARF